jgi:hypothetical protein
MIPTFHAATAGQFQTEPTDSVSQQATVNITMPI